MKRRMTLTVSIWLLLTGCASTGVSQDIATEMVPGRAYEVMTAGQRYFTFTLEVPTHVVLESETFPGDGFISPAGQLLDAEGQVAVRDWNSGDNSNFRIAQQLEPGVWYLRTSLPHVGSSSGRLDRDYRYRVQLRVVDDP